MEKTVSNRKEVTSSLTDYLNKLFISGAGVYHQSVVIYNLLKHPNPDVRQKAENFLHKAEIEMFSSEGIQDLVSCGYDEELSLFFSLKKSAEAWKEKNAQDAPGSSIPENPENGTDQPENAAQAASLFPLLVDFLDSLDRNGPEELLKFLIIIQIAKIKDDSIGILWRVHARGWIEEVFEDQTFRELAGLEEPAADLALYSQLKELLVSNNA